MQALDECQVAREDFLEHGVAAAAGELFGEEFDGSFRVAWREGGYLVAGGVDAAHEVVGIRSLGNFGDVFSRLEGEAGDGDVVLSAREFYLDGVAGGGDKSRLAIGSVSPASLHGEPCEELEHGVVVVWGVVDFDTVDGLKHPLCGGFVEQAGDTETELPAAGPSEVLEDDVGICLAGELENGLERGGGIGPLGAIDDEAVDDLDEAFREEGSEFTLPPEDDGKVGMEVGEDGIAEAPAGGSCEEEGDLFAARGFSTVEEVAVGGDPSAESGLWVIAIDFR